MKNMDKKKKRILIAVSSLIAVLLLSFTVFASMDNGKDLEEKVLGGNDTNITQEKDKAKAKDKTKVQQTEDTESKEEAAESKDEKSKTDTKKTTGSAANSTSSSGSTGSSGTSGSSNSGSKYGSSASGSGSSSSASSGGSTSSSGGSSSGSTGSSSGSNTPAPKPAHTHSYGGWNVDQSSGTKSRYCSCGASETVAATKVIDQAYQPGYYKTEYREEPNWVPTWYVNRGNGNVQICYSEEEAYNLYMNDDTVIQWGTGEDVQQGTISVPYDVWVPEVPEMYHWE